MPPTTKLPLTVLVAASVAPPTVNAVGLLEPATPGSSLMVVDSLLPLRSKSYRAVP